MNRIDYEKLVQEAQKEGINRYVVGAVIENNSNVLLLERPNDDFMGGIYELPSGKLEPGELLDAALYREVYEETGLKIINIERYLGYFDYYSKSGEKTRQFNFTVLVEQPYEIRLQEHNSYIWADKHHLQTAQVTESVKDIISITLS